MTWEQARVRRLFRVVNGGTPTAETENWGGGIPWATPVDLAAVDGHYISTTQRSLTETGLRAASRLVRPGSLIISTRAPIGYVAQTQVPMALNQGCRGLEPIADLDARFFRYQLSLMKRHLNGAGQGSTFVELSSEAIASTLVTVPALEHQRRIADFLDCETAKIDTLVALRRRVLLAAVERFDALVEARVGPSGLRMERLRRLAGGVTVGVVVNPSTYVEDGGEIPFLRGVDVSRYAIRRDNAERISRESNRLLRKSILRHGDVVSVRVGEPGVSAIVPPELHGSNCASLLITRRSARVESRYLCYVFNSTFGRSQFRALANGAAQLQVNVSDAVDFLVPVRAIDEQRKLADELDVARFRLDVLREKTREQVALLSERRQALITAAVTGRIDVARGAA